MKKRFALLLIVLAFTITACGSKDVEKETKKENTNTSSTNTKVEKNENNDNKVEVGLNEVEKVFHPATSANYATIKVDSSIKMDDESAWLGLVPQGKDYITELEADEVDVIWWSLDARESESDPYVWACDFESVEDGKYDVVVATSDDENVGYVVIQLSMEKKGDKLSFDFENAKIKERPTN